MYVLYTADFRDLRSKRLYPFLTTTTQQGTCNNK